jgi:hypothetical protein
MMRRQRPLIERAPEARRGGIPSSRAAASGWCITVHKISNGYCIRCPRDPRRCNNGGGCEQDGSSTDVFHLLSLVASQLPHDIRQSLRRSVARAELRSRGRGMSTVTYCPILTTRRNFLAQSPELVRRFLLALFEANSAYEAAKDQMIPIMSDWSGVEERTIRAAIERMKSVSTDDGCASQSVVGHRPSASHCANRLRSILWNDVSPSLFRVDARAAHVNDCCFVQRG